MSFPIKAWIRFYFKLSLISAWNGVLRFGYVASGAAAAQLTQLIDIRTLGVGGFGWLLLGTMLASVAGALYRHQLPEPNEPTEPTLTPAETAAINQQPPVS